MNHENTHDLSSHHRRPPERRVRAATKQRIRNRRREYLYQLRAQEKRGRQLAALGWTAAMAEEQDQSEEWL